MNKKKHKKESKPIKEKWYRDAGTVIYDQLLTLIESFKRRELKINC